jgi:hypothetical protein
MQALFRTADSPDVVGRAVWAGPGVRIEADDDGVRLALARMFRPIPVAVDDPALRPPGTTGPVVVPPGTLAWFIEAAKVRAEKEGLKVSFVPSGEGGAGWDPAGTYRPFALQIERLEALPAEADPVEQPGEARTAAGTGEGERTPV